MREIAVAVVFEVLHVRSKTEYLCKIAFLCCLTTGLSVLIEWLMGSDLRDPFGPYFAVVSLIAAPLFSLGMLLLRHMKKLQDDLAKIASTDLLTGLNNRRAFFEQLGEDLDGSMVLLDVDHFKRINDTYGHAAGDEVLVAIAKHMKTHVGDLGLLARIGGEEFAIFTPSENETKFLDVVRKVISGVPVNVADKSIVVTLSAGVARADRELDVSDLMSRADEALYDAKSAGRACLRRWSGLATEAKKKRA